MKFKGIYFKKNWKGTYIVLLVILGIILPLILLARFKIEQPISHSPLEERIEGGGDRFDRFRIKGVSIVSFDGNHRRLSIEANEIIHRNRRSGLFTYYNLKEIYISGLKIESYPVAQPAVRQKPHHLEEQSLYGKSGLLNSSFIDTGRRLPSLMALPSMSEDHLNNLDMGSDILTRIVIERLLLTVNLREGAKVVISSDIALIDFEGITFEGDFLLTSSDGKNLTAPLAIWTEDLEGIYLPAGYLLQANGINQRGERAIFMIDQRGKLLRSNKQPPHNISKLNRLEEAEVAFNNLLVKNIIRYIPSLGKIFPDSLVTTPPSRDSDRGKGGEDQVLQW